MQVQITFDFQSQQEAEFPLLVQIVLMHYICNSRCNKCLVGLVNRREIGHDKKGKFDPKIRIFFPFELFPKVADEIGKYPWPILRFHGCGEPLLHPDYIKMIAYGKQAGIGMITSFANGILLNKEMSKAILDAGLDVLELSIEAYSEQLYREIRGTKYFSQVIENALNFIRLRNSKSEYTKTRVIVSAVDCPEF